MVPPVQFTAGIIHIRLCELKTVYMIPPVKSTESIIHVRLYHPKTVYMIPPVQSRAGIIHESLCELKRSTWYLQYNPQQELFM